MNDGQPTPCYGLHRLFESTHPEDHAYARQLCDRCPVLAACAENTAALRATPGSYLEGTWAGTLYKSRTFPDTHVPRRRRPVHPTIPLDTLF